MAKRSGMSLGTLNTILNTAPLIIQGASKLIRMIKDRNAPVEKDETIPATLDSLKQEMQQVRTRLDENTASDIEQIKLIEELAKQNEALAVTLRKTVRQLTIISVLAILALGIAFYIVIKNF